MLESANTMSNSIRLSTLDRTINYQEIGVPRLVARHKRIASEDYYPTKTWKT